MMMASSSQFFFQRIFARKTGHGPKTIDSSRCS
jgi:hypothetical protein